MVISDAYVAPTKKGKRLPQLLTDHELVAFYEAVWQARDPKHMVLIKVLIFTGLRNSELAKVKLQDVDLDHCQIRVVQGKGGKDRSVLIPTSFRGELAQYMRGLQDRRAVYLFESNRLRPYSNRRIRQIVHEYAQAAGIRKRVYPHLLRHSIATILLDSGQVPIDQLQKFLGHLQLSTTQIYAETSVRALGENYLRALGDTKT